MSIVDTDCYVVLIKAVSFITCHEKQSHTAWTQGHQGSVVDSRGSWRIEGGGGNRGGGGGSCGGGGTGGGGAITDRHDGSVYSRAGPGSHITAWTGCNGWLWAEERTFHYDAMAWKRFLHYWPFVRGIL